MAVKRESGERKRKESMFFLPLYLVLLGLAPPAEQASLGQEVREKDTG